MDFVVSSSNFVVVTDFVVVSSLSDPGLELSFSTVVVSAVVTTFVVLSKLEVVVIIGMQHNELNDIVTSHRTNQAI